MQGVAGHIPAGLVALACSFGGTSAKAVGPSPPELLAQLLVASDIADACPGVVQRRAGRDRNSFVAEGVVQIINENDVTMTELMAALQDIDHQRMHFLKRDELLRRGVDLTNRREVCFFAKQIVGSADRIGRYLEAL